VRARCLALAVALTALATPALADPTSEKRSQALELAGEAMDLVDAGDYKAALGKFEQADAIVSAPTIKLEMARCLDKLDRLQEAAAKYREVIATNLTPKSPVPHQEARKAAVKELQALLEVVPTLTVTVVGAGAEEARVTLGARTIRPEEIGEAISLDPGSYVVEATSGERRAHRAFKAERGDDRQIVLELPERAAPLPAPVASDDGGGATLRTVGWVGVGVGGAVLSIGSILGVVVVTEEGDLLDRCPERQCPPEAHDDARSFDQLRVASTATLVSGGVVAAVGVLLVVLAPSGAGDGADTALHLGPDGIGGRF
jgi:hypothetical protein